MSIKDPITDQEFSRALTDDEITSIMEIRFKLDMEIVRQEQIFNGIVKMAKEKLDNSIEELRNFDEKYLPGVRATVIENRNAYERTEQVTPHYVIQTKIPKQEQPEYEITDPKVEEWVGKNHPQIIKTKILKTDLNRIIKGMDKKKIPSCIQMKLPKPKITITRLLEE